MQGHANLLDKIIPLRGASHADVVEYATDSPMRYTECFARLADGREVRFRNPRHFTGWAESSNTLTLLFTGSDRHVELSIDRSGARGVNTVTHWRISDKKPNGHARYFFGKDGSQIVLELADRLSVVPTRQSGFRQNVPSLDPYPEWRACRNRAASGLAH